MSVPVLLDLLLPDRQTAALLKDWVEEMKAMGGVQLPLAEAIERAFSERSREGRNKKARRLLAEGRLTVENITPAGLLVARCRGDSGEVYRLGFDPRASQWRCTCQEMKGRCSHLAALMLVTVKPTPEEGIDGGT